MVAAFSHSPMAAMQKAPETMSESLPGSAAAALSQLLDAASMSPESCCRRARRIKASLRAEGEEAGELSEAVFIILSMVRISEASELTWKLCSVTSSGAPTCCARPMILPIKKRITRYHREF